MQGDAFGSSNWASILFCPLTWATWDVNQYTSKGTVQWLSNPDSIFTFTRYDKHSSTPQDPSPPLASPAPPHLLWGEVVCPRVKQLDDLRPALNLVAGVHDDGLSEVVEEGVEHLRVVVHHFLHQRGRGTRVLISMESMEQVLIIISFSNGEIHFLKEELEAHGCEMKSVSKCGQPGTDCGRGKFDVHDIHAWSGGDKQRAATTTGAADTFWPPRFTKEAG